MKERKKDRKKERKRIILNYYKFSWRPFQMKLWDIEKKGPQTAWIQEDGFWSLYICFFKKDVRQRVCYKVVQTIEKWKAAQSL
jgi:hypothetical protein